jgi:AraC family transcriptional regulator
MPDGVYGSRLGKIVGVGTPPTIEFQLFRRTPFALTWVCRKNAGYIAPLPREDAYLIGLQLRDVPQYPYWLDGQHISMPTIAAGQFTLFDLKVEHASYLTDPMECLAFYISQTALDGLAIEHNAPRITSLNIPPTHRLDDAVVRGLGYSLMPALQWPERANRLFLDSIALAFLTHISLSYGKLNVASQSRRGGLARWQERRVKEALLARINGNISLGELAGLIGLSRSHFARAFKMTTGVPPHRWLLARRVETAEDLLLHTKLPIEDIADRCGFADQSHLTRTFSRMRGVSPGEWRRQRRD